MLWRCFSIGLKVVRVVQRVRVEQLLVEQLMAEQPLMERLMERLLAEQPLTGRLLVVLLWFHCAYLYSQTHLLLATGIVYTACLLVRLYVGFTA